jgi:CBS domain containing-hemolysin-like protein
VIELLLILVALLLVAACGAFVAAEFAFVTVDRPSVERAAKGGDRQARGVQSALRGLSTQLSAAQAGITVTNLLIGFLAEPAIARLVDGPLESAGVPAGAVGGIALAIALVLATGVTMIFGELVPKNLAIAHPLATARAVQAFQRGFTRAAGPVIRFFNGTANAILRRIGVEPQEELASARSPEELASLAGHSAREGTLEASTATLLQRSIDFTERRAHEIMTPRGRMRALDAGASVHDVIELSRASGLSRFPVRRGDGFAGVAHVKDAVTVPFERRRDTGVAAIMKPPLLAPAALELDHLLDSLRAGGLQMALVVDEFGNVDGLVTLEDLVEEIVGEVRDEHDPGEFRASQDPDGGWTLSGLLRPDEVERLTGHELPDDGEYETVAGLVADELARMPNPGDSVTVGGELVLTVVAMDGLRVDRIRLAAATRTGS